MTDKAKNQLHEPMPWKQAIIDAVATGLGTGMGVLVLIMCAQTMHEQTMNPQRHLLWIGCMTLYATLIYVFARKLSNESRVHQRRVKIDDKVRTSGWDEWATRFIVISGPMLFAQNLYRIDTTTGMAIGLFSVGFLVACCISSLVKSLLVRYERFH